MESVQSAFNFTDRVTFKKNLIPSMNNQYDVGNAEFKVRDIYESDSVRGQTCDFPPFGQHTITYM